MRPAVYKHYLLGVLTLLLLFNYVDRMALSIVLQDIKVDLHLSDTQIGFLSGIAFALFYSVMGLPIARWADRGNRIVIISTTAALWSVTVALCGAATSFVQLLLIRIGVAVGEAGCIPPAASLIAEYFNRAERPRANAIYAMGGALSLWIGFFFAGWLNELYGWRATFVVLAAPGLVLAALALFTLHEPRRTRSAASPAQSTMAVVASPSLKEVLRALWGNATFRGLLICQAGIFLFGYGILQWQPAFFMRSFGLNSGEVGTWMAVTYGTGGLLGTWLGGEWATRHAPNNERLQMRMVAVGIVVAAALQIFSFLAPNPYVAFVLAGVAVLFFYSVGVPMSSTLQTVVPERMRAVAVAIWYFVANLVGLGFGPLAAGFLSDMYRTWAGEESLRYSLLSMAPGYLIAVWAAWLASKSVTRDLAKA